MRATDLRIGNLTMYRDVIVKVDLVDLQVHQEENCLEPIPLTEEWLLKFGFERILGAKKVIYKLRVNNTIFTYDEDGYLRFDGAFIPCSNVNQLQNAVFALTGEELEYEI